MKSLKLYMLLLGCTPKGRYVEQHDIFFGIGYQVKDLVNEIKQFWPEGKTNMHVDAWREVTNVDGYTITVVEKFFTNPAPTNPQLFFINLGGYTANDFDEKHYKMLVVADNKFIAAAKAKQTAFYKHTSLKDSEINLKATAHIDNQYGVDVDELYAITDILPNTAKEKYSIQITAGAISIDEYHLGYYKLSDL